MKVLFELYDSVKPLNNVITSLALRPDRVVFLGDRRLNQVSCTGSPNRWRESILRVFEGALLHCDVEWVSAETSYEAIYDALEQNIDLYEGEELIADATGGSEYMLLAESKGISGPALIFRHALRNALIPIITVLAPLIVDLMTGSLVVEKIFAIPGVGSLLVNAIQSNDYNVVISLSFIYSALYIAIMLVVDILYGIIDPRIRLAKDNG